MIDDDLDVLYDTDGFARTFTRAAGLPDEVSFAAIFSAVDAESLEGLALNGEYQLTYPNAGIRLRKGDLLTDSGGAGYAPGTVWRVREHAKRIVDGQESLVPLSLESAP